MTTLYLPVGRQRRTSNCYITAMRHNVFRVLRKQRLQCRVRFAKEVLPSGAAVWQRYALEAVGLRGG
jgi:hypothetical protein